MAIWEACGRLLGRGSVSYRETPFSGVKAPTRAVESGGNESVRACGYIRAENETC